MIQARLCFGKQSLQLCQITRRLLRRFGFGKNVQWLIPKTDLLQHLPNFLDR